MGNKYDGWIIIGGKLDTKQLESELRSMNRKLKSNDNETKQLLDKKANIEFNLANYDELKERIANIRKKMKELNDFWNEHNIDPKEYMQLELQYRRLEDRSVELSNELDKQSNQHQKHLDQLAEVELKLYDISKESENIRKNATSLNSELKKTRSIDQVSKSIDNIGKSLRRTIRNTARWALAIFSIRSAYFFVRQAMSTLSEYNTQLATDVDYIRFALASSLEPVIEKIIQLVFRLLQYLAYFIKLIFGINIFARATTDAFNKTNSAIGKAAKNAKELKNQLASFDEMNVLQDTTASDSSSGSGSGWKTPSIDLSELEGKRPWWLDWILEHKDEILAFIAGLTAGLIALRVLGLDPIMSLGIGIAIAGLVLLIQDIIDFIKDPSWEKFIDIVRDIALVVLGVALAFEAWPVAVAAAAVLIVALIIKYWDEIKAFFQKGIDWLISKSESIRNKFGDTIGGIYEYFVSGLQLMLTGFDTFFKGLKQIFNGIITFIKGVFTGDWKKAWEGIKEIFKGIMTSLSGLIQTVLGTIRVTIGTFVTTLGAAIWSVFKSIINTILDFVESQLNKPIYAINSLISTINKIPGVNIGKLSGIRLPRLAKGGIINIPGKGVPIGSAIAGEKGQEGVIPLTDSQQMQLLGEAIGKYITVNANITNTMNGRVISRELQKINNESDFAFNR